MSRVEKMRLPDPELFAVSIKNLKGQGLRTILTLLGIVIGIAAIFALISIGEGLNAAVEQQFSALGSNTFMVLPGQSFVETVLAELGDDDADVVRSVRGIENASEMYMAAMQVSYKGEKRTSVVVGIPPEQQQGMERLGFLALAEGRLLRPADTSAVIIGPKFAENVFDDELGLRQNLDVNGTTMRVVGITQSATHSFAAMFNSAAIMTAGALEDAAGTELAPSRIIVRVAPGFDVEEVKQEVFDALKKEHNNTEDFQIITASQMTEIAGAVIGLIQLVLVGIAAISLVVGGIGIMNMMFMSVFERTREIGVMKAIGATNRRVLSIFITEAALIGFIGGLIGAGLGFGAAAGVSAVAGMLEIDLPIVLNPALLLGVLAFAVFVGVLSGFYPALRAARLDPVEALRAE